MLTNLHRKIKSMCVFPRKGPAHWILVGCRTSWISEIQEIVSTRRAAYAAFRGEVPEGMDVRSNCGVVPCICPDHAILTESRYCARALSLPGQLAALARPDAFCPPDQSGILPRGLTLALVELVKFLSREKNTLAQIATATGLARREIVAIRGGKRDAAATTLRCCSGTPVAVRPTRTQTAMAAAR